MKLGSIAPLETLNTFAPSSAKGPQEEKTLCETHVLAPSSATGPQRGIHYFCGLTCFKISVSAAQSNNSARIAR